MLSSTSLNIFNIVLLNSLSGISFKSYLVRDRYSGTGRFGRRHAVLVFHVTDIFASGLVH